MLPEQCGGNSAPELNDGQKLPTAPESLFLPDDDDDNRRGDISDRNNAKSSLYDLQLINSIEARRSGCQILPCGSVVAVLTL